MAAQHWQICSFCIKKQRSWITLSGILGKRKYLQIFFNQDKCFLVAMKSQEAVTFNPSIFKRGQPYPDIGSAPLLKLWIFFLLPVLGAMAPLGDTLTILLDGSCYEGTNVAQETALCLPPMLNQILAFAQCQRHLFGMYGPQCPTCFNSSHAPQHFKFFWVLERDYYLSLSIMVKQ